MTDEAGGRDVRQTLISAAIAGVVALLVLIVLAAVNVGSDVVQAAVAIVTGVIAGQAYEYTR